jgi:pimeloyl-ACP methyl ester carboxylesterase
MDKWQTNYITVNGSRLHYYRTGGNKPTIILAHGITDNGLCWTRLAQALEDRYDLILYDARGHGLSDQAEDYSLEAHVTDVTGFIEALELNNVFLLGHSMGGAHLPFVAAEQPHLVRGLLLEDPHWPQEPEDETSYDLDTWRKNITLEKAQSLESLLELGRKNNPNWDEAELYPWAQAKQQVDPNVVNWLYSWCDINNWRGILKKVACPTLLLTGDTDVTVIPEVAKEAAQICSKLEVAQMTNAGHSIRRDQFAGYLRAVAAFLDEVASV